MRQARHPAGVQVQPDNQNKPRQTPAAGTLRHSGRKFTLKPPLLNPFPPLLPTQGAHTACARVSELQVFTQAAEVKVDPDKPLEAARLAVLEVALHWQTDHQYPRG